MPRHQHLRLVLLLAALLAVLAVGCSDDDDDEGSGTEAATTPTETAPAQKPKPSGRKAKRRAGKAKRGRGAKRRVSKAELEKERRALRREEAEDRKEDRQFDKAFNETRFEKLVAQLPIRKPPLFVEQYITSRGSSTVHTAVDPKRFFCGRSLARRRAAVKSFYEDADRVFRRGGVDDLVQIVTPIAETTERLPALAVGRDGKVSLTKRGRAKGRC